MNSHMIMVLMELVIHIIMVMVTIIIITIQHSSLEKLIIILMQFSYQLYQTIPSCTIWYCIAYYYNDFDIGSYNNGTSDYKWNHGYGRIQYNHFLNYDINSNTFNGTLGDTTIYKYGNYGNIFKRENAHNTTLLFGNSSNMIFIPNYPIMYYMVLFKL